MKDYEVHTYYLFSTILRYQTDNLDEARAKAREIEETSSEDFEGTAIYDNIHHNWLEHHEREID